jgi:hypothetical protein
VKLDEEKSKYAGLAHQNCFGSPKLESVRCLVKGTATLCTGAQKNVINMI